MCIVNRLVPIPYFLDEMHQYEMSELISVLKYADMGDWERTRLLAFIIASPYAKKGTLHSPKDVFALPWDVDEKAELKKQLKKTVTLDEVNKLNDEAKKLNDFLNNNKDKIKYIPITGK